MTGRGCSTKNQIFSTLCENHVMGGSEERFCYCSYFLCNTARNLNLFLVHTTVSLSVYLAKDHSYDKRPGARCATLQHQAPDCCSYELLVIPQSQFPSRSPQCASQGTSLLSQKCLHCQFCRIIRLENSLINTFDTNNQSTLEVGWHLLSAESPVR